MNRKSAACIKVAIATAATAGLAPAWTVNKCVIDGQVVFQNTACPGKGETVRVLGAGQAGPDSQGPQYWQRESARQKRSAVLEENIAQRKVAIGMTSDDVLASWGKPNKINKTVTAGGTTEQWVYEGAKFRHQYVYLDNGTVRSIQSPE